MADILFYRQREHLSSNVKFFGSHVTTSVWMRRN